MKRLQPLARGRALALLVGLPLALALAAGTAAQTLPSPVLINESPSLPRGVYWRAWGDKPGVGSVVAIGQPGASRPYLAGLGLPADLLLIKRVIATGGEVVCIGDGALETPRGRYRVLDRDRQGLMLPVWRGCRPLRSDELFLLGDTETSFDSRYFGPVSRSQILGVYREGSSW